ncbi:hypothetical protein J5Y09_11320 [Roseomonas sp. PWR1]|uniref:Uncharacterized protein n=1 Tax=Roseomonas nitratireducens TaxID=2820810 RepID=A0ABS4AT40_9PROT|nr:hypothetical protein [Neoroseomonas nitratireducens]MBP0464496.1 hypothetical protein [Neoroseomonas nitratireducens]
MSGTTSTTGANFAPPPQANGITDLINNSSNMGREVTQTIASTTLEQGLRVAGRAGAGTVAGALVQPAVWVLSGRPPQPGDVALWGGGVVAGIVAGTFGAVASAVTGVIKAAVEDHEDGIIEAAKAREPARYRPFITSVRNYGASGRGIVAMTIANHGGVTWRVGPATWVYITDAMGRLVCDYRPVFAHEIYGPILPLRIVGTRGGAVQYQWTTRPGNIHG